MDERLIGSIVNEINDRRQIALAVLSGSSDSVAIYRAQGAVAELDYLLQYLENLKEGKEPVTDDFGPDY